MSDLDIVDALLAGGVENFTNAFVVKIPTAAPLPTQVQGPAAPAQVAVPPVAVAAPVAETPVPPVVPVLPVVEVVAPTVEVVAPTAEAAAVVEVVDPVDPPAPVVEVVSPVVEELVVNQVPDLAQRQVATIVSASSTHAGWSVQFSYLNNAGQSSVRSIIVDGGEFSLWQSKLHFIEARFSDFNGIVLVPCPQSVSV